MLSLLNTVIFKLVLPSKILVSFLKILSSSGYEEKFTRIANQTQSFPETNKSHFNFRKNTAKQNEAFL